MKTYGQSIVLMWESFDFASFSLAAPVPDQQLSQWNHDDSDSECKRCQEFFKWDKGAYEVDKLARPTSTLFVTSPWYDSKEGFLERDPPLPWTRAVPRAFSTSSSPWQDAIGVPLRLRCYSVLRVKGKESNSCRQPELQELISSRSQGFRNNKNQ